LRRLVQKKRGRFLALTLERVTPPLRLDDASCRCPSWRQRAGRVAKRAPGSAPRKDAHIGPELAIAEAVFVRPPCRRRKAPGQERSEGIRTRPAPRDVVVEPELEWRSRDQHQRRSARAGSGHSRRQSSPRSPLRRRRSGCAESRLQPLAPPGQTPRARQTTRHRARREARSLRARKRALQD